MPILSGLNPIYQQDCLSPGASRGDFSQHLELPALLGSQPSSFHLKNSSCTPPASASLVTSLNFPACLLPLKRPLGDFPGRPVVENQPAIAGDAQKQAPTCLEATKPVYHSYWALAIWSMAIRQKPMHPKEEPAGLKEDPSATTKTQHSQIYIYISIYFKDPCDDTGPTWIRQDTYSLHKTFNLITSVKSLLPWKVTHFPGSGN